MNETFEEAQKVGCSICQSKKDLIPKAGSGTVIHWVCLECVLFRNLEVEQEYIDRSEAVQN